MKNERGKVAESELINQDSWLYMWKLQDGTSLIHCGVTLDEENKCNQSHFVKIKR